jgi:hypothetical protein
MKRGVWMAGILIVLAIVGFRAARILRRYIFGQSIRISGAPDAPEPGTPDALVKLGILDDILRSRNDNDPRLDSEFNHLTLQTKVLFQGTYGGLRPEKRNERGTIVYLLGKNTDSAGDWAFLRIVVTEPPCLSLADCSKKPARGGGEEAMGDEVTLAYPCLVALKSAQRVLESSKDPNQIKGAQSVVAAAKTSKVSAVVKLAEKISP